MEPPVDEVLSLTEQLRLYPGCDRSMAEEVFRTVLPELHRVAERELGRKHDRVHFSPTELINEVWLRNLRKGGWQINSRKHFYAIAAHAMRHVLIDHARKRKTFMRDQFLTVPLLESAEIEVADELSRVNLVQIGILMERIEKEDPVIAHIIDLHYFAGFTLEEISEITGLSRRKVKHLWEKGRDRLKDGLRA